MNSAYIAVVGVVVVCCLAQDNNKATYGVTGSIINGKSHRLFKRAIPRLWNTYGSRLPWKRNKIDNHINNIPDYPAKPAEEGVGDAIMDEFMLFLALKDSGMLDLCMNTAPGIF